MANKRTSDDLLVEMSRSLDSIEMEVTGLNEHLAVVQRLLREILLAVRERGLKLPLAASAPVRSRPSRRGPSGTAPSQGKSRTAGSRRKN